MPEHVVVVGAGLGGLRVVERLRSGGYPGSITLVGAETHLPYDRPPLSKQVLAGTWEPHRVLFHDEAGLAALGVTPRLGRRAVAMHGSTVELDDGTSVAGDAVVVATGVVPRTLPEQPAGVAVLRTLDDALALRAALTSARSLIVVGAGFIGAEVAHAARVLGVEVTVLEAGAVPVERGLGARVGALAARLFTEAGADLRCGVRIAGVPDAHTVVLADGETLSADVVLVAIGATPDLGWLADRGLTTTDGLACDQRGRVVGADGVWALGDVAAWYDPVTGTHRRAEHWTTTNDQAARVAHDLLGTELPLATLPYAWSDQFGLKIQTIGRTGTRDSDDVVVLHGDGLHGGPVKGTVVGYLAGDTLVGVASFGAPAKFVRYRAAVAAGADRAAVLALADAGAPVPG